MSIPITATAALYALTVEFEVHHIAFEKFGQLVRDNAEKSVALEPGCLRFDVLTPVAQAPKPAFLLYEIYADRAAFESHLTTTHFKRFDAETKAMVTRKTVVVYNIVEHAKAAQVIHNKAG